MADKPDIKDARARLKAHFSEYQGEKYVDGWEKLWEKGDCLPWDRRAPNPALVDTLVQRHDLIGTAVIDENGQGQRKKALVPGCGRGVDVLLLASCGYDAYGLEYSQTAYEACKKEEEEHGQDYPVRDSKLGKGKITFVVGDFFKDEWLAKAGVEGKFDLIYDYTFFCALNPSFRPAWSLRMSQLLAPSPQGNLICLEFPVKTPASTGGPPFSSPPNAYMEHLSHPGEKIDYDENGDIKTEALRRASENGLERVAHWQPERTHEIGKDEQGNVMDWVAVWRHRS